jgi:hypothetical protein
MHIYIYIYICIRSYEFIHGCHHNDENCYDYDNLYDIDFCSDNSLNMIITVVVMIQAF